MYLEKIKLENFRNYESEEIDFHKNINIITGDNAQGKTNLLESIYFSSFTRSFRTSSDKEMIGFGKDFCRVCSSYSKNDETEEVEIAMNREGKKTAKVNGVKVDKLRDVVSDYYVIVFSPEDMKIVKDEPEKRRNFLDREICQMSIGYLESLAKYKKLLLQRNAYLKEDIHDNALLDIWDENLAEEGAKIMIKRKDFVDKLSAISEDIHVSITDGKEIPMIEYRPNIEYRKDPEEQKEIFLDLLSDNRQRDIMQGNTANGPHKDDLDIMIEGVSTRKYGSQGQQRTAALSLKLAEIELIKEEKGEYPILLLDDVLSELDEKRQRFLVDHLEKTQIFITAAEVPEDIIKYFPENRKIEIEKGKVKKDRKIFQKAEVITEE